MVSPNMTITPTAVESADPIPYMDIFPLHGGSLYGHFPYMEDLRRGDVSEARISLFGGLSCWEGGLIGLVGGAGGPEGTRAAGRSGWPSVPYRSWRPCQPHWQL